MKRLILSEGYMLGRQLDKYSAMTTFAVEIIDNNYSSYFSNGEVLLLKGGHFVGLDDRSENSEIVFADEDVLGELRNVEGSA